MKECDIFEGHHMETVNVSDPPATHNHKPWRVESIEIGFRTTIFKNKCQKRNIIKVSKQLFAFLMPTGPTFSYVKANKHNLFTGVVLRRQILKKVPHSTSEEALR